MVWQQRPGWLPRPGSKRRDPEQRWSESTTASKQRFSFLQKIIIIHLVVSLSACVDFECGPLSSSSDSEESSEEIMINLDEQEENDVDDETMSGAEDSFYDAIRSSD